MNTPPRKGVFCPDCNNPITASARLCPHCKRRFNDAEIKARGGWITTPVLVGTGVLVALTLTALAIFAPQKPDAGQTSITPAEVKPSPSEVLSEKEIAERKAATKKIDAVAFYKKVLSVVRPCDQASSITSRALKAGDVITAYRAADQADNVCLSTPSALRDVNVPDSFDSKTADAAKNTLETCEKTYLAKWDAAKKLKVVLDGDTRASVLAAVQENAEVVNSGTFVCVGGLVAIAMDAGATSEELGIAKDAGGKK